MTQQKSSVFSNIILLSFVIQFVVIIGLLKFNLNNWLLLIDISTEIWNIELSIIITTLFIIFVQIIPCLFSFNDLSTSILFNPHKDVDLSVNSDFEESSTFMLDVFEFLEQDKALLTDFICELGLPTLFSFKCTQIIISTLRLKK